jgi:hypothetical protein
LLYTQAAVIFCRTRIIDNFAKLKGCETFDPSFTIGDTTMAIIDAQVIDEMHLKLSRPINIPRGAKVRIFIAPPEPEQEQKDWTRLSVHGLEAAYGSDEPEYSIDHIKVLNLEFDPQT